MRDVGIQTNITSISAHRNMSSNDTQFSTAFRRMSSGFRIISAADDAAGLSISTKMRAQLWSVNQAIRNAQDAISLIQTAEGAVATINNMIIRMRELVIQAANDTMTISDRVRIQEEIYQLIDEIDAISQRTQFNTRVLLDGTYGRHCMQLILAEKNNFFKTRLLLDGFNPHFNSHALSINAAKSGFLGVTGFSGAGIPIMPLAGPILGPISYTLNLTTLVDGAFGTTWNFNAGVLTITGDDNIEIYSSNPAVSTNRRIVVNAGVTSDIVLRDVNISTTVGPAFDARNANVNLFLEGTNSIVTSAGSRAGIETTGGNLVISDGPGAGVGSLTVQGGNYGAGIGGGLNQNSGNITIWSGNITTTNIALGNTSGAGIGSGRGGLAENIAIHGGIINASSGAAGAGIGSGTWGTVGNIVITGGHVTAQSGTNGAGIGTGQFSVANSPGGNISISGGTIIASGHTGIGGGGSGTGGVINITGGDITATGVGGAGIGGGSNSHAGNITISNAIITATSHDGAGIGSGTSGVDGGNIVIHSGTINATSNNRGAGIGSGVWSTSGGNITILGGNVTANGGTGAGIGNGQALAGAGATGGNILISGGTVVASSATHAGIGGGANGSGGVINITGGNITATGGGSGAGIGGGSNGVGGNITISNAIVNATATNQGAGIGGGFSGAGGNITINSGTVTAHNTGNNGAGIGGGQNGAGGTITINNGTVTATSGGLNGAGIGGGTGGAGGTITINNGTVTATASQNGAGIGGGGGATGSGGEITINGGTVNANGSLNGAGIGGGQNGAGGNITINGGITTVTAGANNTAVGGGRGNSAGAILTMNNGLLEILNGWIGGGTTSNNHGTVYFNNGNLSVANWTATNQIRSEVIHNFNPAFRIEVRVYHDDAQTLPLLFAAHTRFSYYVNGTNFFGYTDSNGRMWVFLPMEMYDDFGQMRNPASPGSEFGFTGNVVVSADHANLNNTLILTPGRLTLPGLGPSRPWVPPWTQPELMVRHGNPLHFQIGPRSGNSLFLHINDMSAAALWLRDVNGNATVNVVHDHGVNISWQVAILDRSLSIVTRERSNLGAMQNRLEHTIENLSIYYENLSSAESRIRDADMAKEFIRLTKATIAQHISTAMLAQSNQAPERVLQLLNG